MQFLGFFYLQENYRACGSQCEAAMIERGDARKIMRSKLSEIDFLRSVINRAKSVITIEDLDRQVSYICECVCVCQCVCVFLHDSVIPWGRYAIWNI